MRMEVDYVTDHQHVCQDTLQFLKLVGGVWRILCQVVLNMGEPVTRFGGIRLQLRRHLAAMMPGYVRTAGQIDEKIYTLRLQPGKAGRRSHGILR